MKKNEIEERLKEYREAVKSMETERWVGQFAENATVEDPVGGPVHSGHDQLRTFFDSVRKYFKILVISPETTVIAPPEAAVKSLVTATNMKGKEVAFDLISTYKFREDGKLVQMRAFWTM